MRPANSRWASGITGCPDANKAVSDLVNEWAAKEKVEVAIDFITSQGNKNLVTIAAEAAGEIRP